MKKYQIIYADPPWDMGKFGMKQRHNTERTQHINRELKLPYPCMSPEGIATLDVNGICDTPCHLWLWATNKTLHDAFRIMNAWGFKYLNTLTFVKPSGVGAWFVNTTQHLLFGYRGKLEMGQGRYTKTDHIFIPQKHSKKPDWVYSLIDSISPYDNKIELFAREKMFGWDVWGNEVKSDIVFGDNQ